MVPALIEGTSKKNDTVLLGKSPKNQTVHAPIPEGYSIDQLVGKIVDVDVDVAKTGICPVPLWASRANGFFRGRSFRRCDRRSDGGW